MTHESYLERVLAALLLAAGIGIFHDGSEPPAPAKLPAPSAQPCMGGVTRAAAGPADRPEVDARCEGAVHCDAPAGPQHAAPVDKISDCTPRRPA